MSAKLPKQVQKLISLIEKQEKEIVDTVDNPAKMRLGNLYLMVYDPKHAKTLPFYDVLPMFILLGKGGDRMFGINLHYIPYILRINVARELMKMQSWKKRIQYKDIASAWKSSKAPFGYLYLCLRTYLYNNIRSQIKEFHSQNYDMVIKEVMPQFKKEEEQNIYNLLMSKFYKKAGGVDKVKWKKK